MPPLAFDGGAPIIVSKSSPSHHAKPLVDAALVKTDANGRPTALYRPVYKNTIKLALKPRANASYFFRDI
jgi:hypothetical protein